MYVTSLVTANYFILTHAQLPYLHWDSFKNLNLRARVMEKRGKQDHARPVDRDVADGKSMERKLIWQYLTSNRPIHCRRTLDQYGYPSLLNTSARDADQVLYKRTRRPPPEADPRESTMEHITGILRANRFPAVRHPQIGRYDDASKVLMVDQLWLWVIDQSELHTPFVDTVSADFLHRNGYHICSSKRRRRRWRTVRTGRSSQQYLQRC